MSLNNNIQDKINLLFEKLSCLITETVGLTAAVIAISNDFSELIREIETIDYYIKPIRSETDQLRDMGYSDIQIKSILAQSSKKR